MEQARRGETAAYVIVTCLFFAGLHSLAIDPLVAAVKAFSTGDLEAQLSASAFFIAWQ